MLILRGIENMANRKLILLDSHAIIHRAFHAIRPLTTSAGQPVNAVYGFASILLNVLEIEQPTHLAAAFDLPGRTHRHELDDTYKANRAEAPDDLISQFAIIRELVDAWNIPKLEYPGYEADDLLGTAAAKFGSEPDLQVIMVSGDRDLLQLVTDSVSVHDLTKGYKESVNYTPAKVREKYGFDPEYLPDYKGLAGDSSDNIAGIPGIGPKGATELIQKFGHLENMFRKQDLLPPKLREKFVANYEKALHCRQMATIHRDAPLGSFELSHAELQDFDLQRVLDLLEQLEFRSLQPRVRRVFAEKIAAEKSVAAASQPSLF